jgi:uncharacterized damage-inducible protein DinB
MSKPSSGDHRPEPPAAAPPEELVAAFLDFLRATMLWKLEGLTEEEAARRIAPSGLSLLGMVKHLAYVERSWFRQVFAGETVEFPWTKEDPDADWRIEPGETIASVVALYEAECAAARAIYTGRRWDERAASPDRPVSLGWILTHMVEETGRHCGHADLLRETIDGATGE